MLLLSTLALQITQGDRVEDIVKLNQEYIATIGPVSFHVIRSAIPPRGKGCMELLLGIGLILADDEDIGLKCLSRVVRQSELLRVRIIWATDSFFHCVPNHYFTTTVVPSSESKSLTAQFHTISA